MNFRRKITLSLLLTILLGGAAFAQVVNIPDSNLRDAIKQTLNIAPNAALTHDIMSRLIRLNAGERGVSNLEGLEFAENLSWLSVHKSSITDLTPIMDLTRLETLGFWENPVSDIAAIAKLSKLQFLDARGCRISDISALANLTQLIDVNLGWNRIKDINPLVGLTKLKKLQLTENQIHNTSALANLTNLEWLELQANPIINYKTLDALSLDHILYDAPCNLPPRPLMPRLHNRTFPSIFTAWASTVPNQPQLPEKQQLTLHDLYFSTHIFDGWEYFFDTGAHWDLRGHLPTLVAARNGYLEFNPNMIFLCEIRVRDAHKHLFPEDSGYWVKDSHGMPIEAWPGHYLLNFTSPDVQDMIVGQVLAVERCGLYDGIFFDWWSERTAVLADDSNLWTGGYVGFEAEQRARDIILERIRAEARPNFLILVNTNRSTIPRTAPHINGSFMETGTPSGVLKYWDGDDDEGIERALLETEGSLRWLEDNLREPHINSLEGWGFPDESPDSPRNLRWMRAFTTLSLTHSDGYVLFNDGIQHAHYWYDFWDADLGQPVGEKGQVYQGTDGLYIREYTNGWAVYNHSGSPQVIRLPEEVQGVASGLVNVEHALANLDGEMYLRVTPKNPADVNGDGVVNILDLTLVAQAFGKDGLQGDVNGDGVVNVFDLVFVANQF